MRSTFIWIQVKELAKITYTNSLAFWLKQYIPDLFVLDFDNFSDSYMIDKTIEIVELSERLIVFIEAEELNNYGQIIKFINKLIRTDSKKLLVLFNGRNAVIEKMLKIIDKNQLITEFNIDKQGDILLNFLR